MSQTKAQLLDNIKDNVQLDAQKALRFADSDSSNYVAFKAPATVSSNVTWTLPAADGSANYVLATDGSGNLSWIADPAGQWITSGSNIYFTGGNVGIGDSSPSNPLSVTGASAFNGDVQFTGASYNAIWDKSNNALEFADNAKAIFGTGTDLEIFHDGSNSYIKDSGTGNITLQASQVNFINAAGNETLMQATEDGGVSLYFDNTKKIETSSSGLVMPDSAQFELGTGSDLKLWHNGSHSFIRNETGNLTIEANGAGDDAIKIVPDGAVELYHDGTKKLDTQSWGIDVTGTVQCDQLTLLDNEQIRFGTGADLKIYHDGNNSYIQDDGTGELRLRGTTIRLTDNDGSENFANFNDDGSVDLFHNNVKKFETTSIGCDLTLAAAGDGLRLYSSGNVWGKISADVNRTNTSGGMLSLQGLWNGTQVNIIELQTGDDTTNKDDGRISFYTRNSGDAIRINLQIQPDGNIEVPNDNQQLKMGAGDDVVLYSDGTNAILRGMNGDLYLQSDSDVILSDIGGNETYLKATDNGDVELYYDNVKQLQTTATGVQTYFNTPYVMLGIDATQSVASATEHEVDWDYEVDRENNFDTSNERFTAPVDGDYLFCLSIQYTENVNQMHTGIKKNGAAPGSSFDPWVNWGDSIRAGCTSAILQLSANDYVELWTYQNTGSAKNLETNRTKATIRLLG